ncbi:Growth-regulating factor like [Actinidia chinensis var. chinensis]|uniref:Growth-regulating factor n=1 Tax=Actinidia chinensis var. chinensis TaxID=1590841 RepID=A0A2R6Q5T3_ACTCC|nr:Growth-regulating factor like [Actinidia chinensis var. chinensis]
MDFNLKQWRYESELQLQQQQEQEQEQVASVLPLFVPEVLTEMGSYFSWAQWQELELQALIFRHMLAGACVPPELLNQLVKKSRLSSSSLSPTYYHLPHPLQHYHPASSPSLVGPILIFQGLPLPLISSISVKDPQNQELKTMVHLNPKMKFLGAENPVVGFFAISLMTGQDRFKNPVEPKAVAAQ